MDIHNHFGVYAIILDSSKKNILLIKKARGPYTGQLDLPGGSVEPEELLEEALDREVIEETSCHVTEKKEIKAVSIRYPYFDNKKNIDRVLKHVGVLYKVSVEGEPSIAGDGLDSNGAAWYELDLLNKLEVTPFVKMGIDAML